MESSLSRSSKRPSIRGSRATAFEILCGEPEKINPAILLADRLMRKGFSELLSQEEIDEAEITLLYSRQEIDAVERHLSALIRIKASASAYVPVGF